MLCALVYAATCELGSMFGACTLKSEPTILFVLMIYDWFTLASLGAAATLNYQRNIRNVSEIAINLLAFDLRLGPRRCRYRRCVSDAIQS